MSDNIIECAYAALLHDIGKFYQRTTRLSLLNDREKGCTPIHPAGYHTHLHSGYTSKFFHDYLQLDNYLEKASSSHHLDSLDEFEEVIKRADCIASSIDRNDEQYDYDENYKKTKYRYLTSRLSSIMSHVDFGKQTNDSTFTLESIDSCKNPIVGFEESSVQESVDEYAELFQRFIEEVNQNNLLVGEPTPYKFHRIYSLLYKYTTLIPSSTYETNMQTVSLFDHLKLTTAIASCLIQSQCEKFYMVEFDISGIQKFIYQITEGKDTKKQIAKSLRGRSALVSLITNAVTYKILNEFHLTQANVIFNTGGGAVILLPYLDETQERVNQLFYEIIQELYKRFQTSLTLVYAIEDLNAKELETFKTEKALSLKMQLEEKKMKKYQPIINDRFCVEEFEDKTMCEMCGNHYAIKDGMCENCLDIIKVSDFYTKHDQFTIYYSFNQNDNYDVDFGFAKIQFYEENMDYMVNEKDFFYIDAVNHFGAGNVKMLANLVPKNKKGEVLNFDEIVKLLDVKYGDQKLGILKMDVDNLGAIFAFGLKQGADNDRKTLQRSLSKYLTLSRFMELFFGKKLKDICLKLSQQLQSEYDDIFYINYAGGDDLVILGPIYGIVQLANEIYKEFKDYVQNPNITLSAGIYIQNPKKPIRFGIQMADQALDESKSYMRNHVLEKNAITIMNSTISFDEYSEFLTNVEMYRGYINDSNNPLSRSGFYRIMTQMSEENLEKYYSKIPIIQYSLYRQIDNKNEKLRKDISYDLTSMRTLSQLQKCIAMMKLVILFTREV